MLDHLAKDVLAADYLVDLSSVARMTDPPGPGIHQVGRLIDTLAAQDGDPEVQVYLVADESLPDLLSRADAKTLRLWAELGQAELLGDADARVLELAELTGLTVISRDRYEGHRGPHPWLQGNVTQFLEPFVGQDGRMAVRWADLGRAVGPDVPRAAAKALVRKQDLLARGAVPDRVWRCPVPSCTRYDPAQHGIVPLPRIVAGEPTCGIHGRPLADDGPRRTVVPMRLLVDGACMHRFLIWAGREMTAGRELVELFAGVDVSEAAKVSSSHLAVSYVGGALTIRDDSADGTVIVPSRPERRLGRGDTWALRLGETAHLTGRIGITRTGRRLPTELPYPA
jgi:hypothetical protein